MANLYNKDVSTNPAVMHVVKSIISIPGILILNESKSTKSQSRCTLGGGTVGHSYSLGLECRSEQVVQSWEDVSDRSKKTPNRQAMSIKGEEEERKGRKWSLDEEGEVKRERGDRPFEFVGKILGSHARSKSCDIKSISSTHIFVDSQA